MSRHAGRARGAIVLGVVGALLGLGAIGLVVYDARASERIFTGIHVAGVDVGGMTREEAIAAVSDHVSALTSRPITVSAAGGTWSSTPAALGATVPVEAAVDEAFDIGQELGIGMRTIYRLRDTSVARDVEVSTAIEDAGLEAFVAEIASAVDKKAADARLEFVDGEVIVQPPVEGVRLRRDEAMRMLRDAVSDGTALLSFPVETTEPTSDGSDLGKTIVVDISANTLVLYDGAEVERRFRVATGAPGYPTPLGAFEIIRKAENPTWVNPDPLGWGKDYPASIPPGPGNPLGTRALYLDAPGIRIHGTYNSDSIGTFASHGCVRMLISDSEALYPLVPVGTQVYIVP